MNILVTGATGYIASWIIKKLLEQGHTVHGTVRNLEKKAKYDHLLELEKASEGTLKLFEADLVKEGSFFDAMEGCEVVIHTASPFFVQHIKDPDKQLIQPAQLGTRNVLLTANQHPTVKKVVLTSSVAAIYGDAADADGVKNRTFTEENWNKTSSPVHQPYSYSKTLAEQEAWKIAGEQVRWKLVVINPSFVLGPPLGDQSDSTSNSLLLQLISGKLRTGVPMFWYGIVDVRDVAEAHISAALNDGAEGRHILASGHASFLDIANMIRKQYGDRYPLPRREMPKWLIMLLGPAFGINRKMVKANANITFYLDNTKSREKLGIDYIPVEQTVLEHFAKLRN